jgi:hypothetical protein
MSGKIISADVVMEGPTVAKVNFICDIFSFSIFFPVAVFFNTFLTLF